MTEPPTAPRISGQPTPNVCVCVLSLSSSSSHCYTLPCGRAGATLQAGAVPGPNHCSRSRVTSTHSTTKTKDILNQPRSDNLFSNLLPCRLCVNFPAAGYSCEKASYVGNSPAYVRCRSAPMPTCLRLGVSL